MKKLFYFIIILLTGFSHAQVKNKAIQKPEKPYVNPVKLTKKERSKPYMDEVLKSRDSLSPQEAERRRQNIELANPFKKYGFYPKIATLSKGKYLEVHDIDSIISIGSVRFNRKSREIVELREIDLSDPDAQPYLDTAGRWFSPDPLSEEFSSWTPYNFAFNNPLKFVDPDGRAPFDWVHNRETNQVYWNKDAVSQATAGANETYLGKSGTYTAYDGSTTALYPNGKGQDNSLLGGLGVMNNLDPLIQGGDNAAQMSALAFGNLNDPNAATISAIPDSRGKTEIQMLVAENPLVQGSAMGLLTGGTFNVARGLFSKATVGTVDAMANARSLGAAGEASVGITEAKTGIQIGGKMRFPDRLTATTLEEVKNVGSQSFTRQLRDYLNYSQQTGRQMILHTRPTTTMTGPLKKAIETGQIIHKTIPQ